MEKLTVGELFAGIGGIGVGLERTGGFETVWQVENDKHATRVLEKHWPDVRRWGDIRTHAAELPPADVICGGDPCPKHSRARLTSRSAHPDLSGYFLAVVGRLRPRWVVRENVLAPTVAWFHAALVALGYGAIVVRLDAAEVTGQSRPRDFVVGCDQTDWRTLRKLFSASPIDRGPHQKSLGFRQVTPCLLTDRTRYRSDDCFVWDPNNGLRILDCEERETLAGFPRGWTEGFSPRQRARMLGNAVVPQVARFIGDMILAAHERNQ